MAEYFCGCLVALAFNSFSALAQTAAPNEWTWMGGSSTGIEAPVTGTLGTPAVGNIPAARYEAVAWTDKNGNFWLFGGDSSISPGGDLLLNDLWEFNPTTNEWAWLAGSSASDAPGIYGTMGTPSAQSTPGAREDAAGWTDSKGNLWLFGGYGLDASGTRGVMNDLWEFSPSTGQWTWMNGSSTIGNNCFFGGGACALPSIYGTLGTAAPGNTPGSREAAITWADNRGNLWLFGGWSYDVNAQAQYYFNELWEYNTSTDQWAWMGGSSTRDGSWCFINIDFPLNDWDNYSCGEPGVYGVEGTAAPSNIPGGREGSARWTDSQGNLWLFSGSGFDIGGGFGDPNDLWEFNPSSGQWAWMGGNSAISFPGCDGYDCSGLASYGALGTPAAANIPPGRDHAIGWTDSGGNLWLFGGGGTFAPDDPLDEDAGDMTNDLWAFNLSTNQWTLMGGNIWSICGVFCAQNAGATYVGLGVPAPGNDPGARLASTGWTDMNGNFWLFGGSRLDPIDDFTNDLWEYQPSATGVLPTTATPTISVPTGSYASAQSVTINDATNGAFIYFTTDGTTPTINSTVHFQSQPISIQHSATLQAIAVADGCYTSAAANAVYTLPPPAATPTFSVPGGTYTSFQTVTISDPTPGATIYYTVDGTTPTASSNVYSAPIGIVDSLTLRAVATASGYSISYVGSATYTLNLPTAAMPTFSPADGTYNAPQTVTISDSTPGATIYYQVNGYPSTGSPVYSIPITVSSSETIRSIATATNYFPSGLAGASYDINPLALQTAAPTFSVHSGTYSTALTVTISDATSLASIYFTTDGSTPTTGSALYAGPITVSTSETLQAIATATGDTNSTVATAAYTINLSPPSFIVSGTSVTVTPGATTGNTSTITLTPLGGFIGTISLSCAISPAAASDPATCGIPASVSIGGSSAQTTTLTVNTTAATSALNQSRKSSWRSAGGAALACTLLVGIPARRRRWRNIVGMLGLLFCIIAGVVACGSSSGGGGGGGGGGNSGTSAGTYTVTVTGTSGTIVETGTVTLTVQ